MSVGGNAWFTLSGWAYQRRLLDKRRMERREHTHMVNEELRLCWRVADVPDKQ